MLWIPGPTEVRPELLQELTRPMIGHRSQEMTELVERTDPGLRFAFGTEASSGSAVAVGTHSATAMMEGALSGVGPRVLSIVNGAFSKRWGQIATCMQKDAHIHELPLGEAIRPEALAELLEQHGPFDAVTLVVNETSTGVRTDVAQLRPVLAAHPDTLLLVDVVSAIAGYAIDLDANGIDFALAGINKALALPPGLTVMAASARYLEVARRQERTTWYLDPVRTIDGHAKRKTPTTPCIPLYRALVRQLEDITDGVSLPEADRSARGAEAWNARFAKHARMQARTLAWAAGHGIHPFPAPELCSATVSCLRADGIDVSVLLEGLAARGETIGNGYGDLKGKTFRIGHMGDHTEAGLEALLATADDVLVAAGARA